MRFSPRPLACLVALVLAPAVSGCGGKEEESGGPAATAGPSTSAVAEPPAVITHILIAYRGAERAKATRSQDEALALAKSLINDINAGRSMEDLVKKFTDDRDSKGQPNAIEGAPGRYTVSRGPGADPRKRMTPEFEKAAFETPVGKITPEPVKTPFGYHILRREK